MDHPEIAETSLASQLKLDAHWMPYTANRSFQRDPRMIVAAHGSYLTDDQGRKIYDSLSGCGPAAPVIRAKRFRKRSHGNWGLSTTRLRSNTVTLCRFSWLKRSLS